jgi:uncharacterized protein YdeI (YjbR/CyaY-like superfamily)
MTTANRTKPIFFTRAAEFRQWLHRHHGKEMEVVVGIFRKNAGCDGLTYAEAVDEALCFGWIDGITHKVDEASYAVRFTPRRARSNWSLTNVRNVDRLVKAGKMHPAGVKAFEAREEKRTGVYSFEQAAKELPSSYEKEFRSNVAAWKFFQAQPPYYRRLLTHKIVSPKQEATRRRWLNRLIKASAAGRRVE